jgi:dolichyl-phosphate-mannose-protein mannosyltransferase
MERLISRPPRALSSARVWTSILTREHVLGACIAVLLGLGVYLRVHAFDYPEKLLFDEHHFVKSAQNYLLHRGDGNDHPPLGKLLIALSILLFGDHAFAWRIPSLCAGLLLVALGGWASARLFQSPLAGWLAAALLSADGFFIGYSRVALLDGFLALGAIVALLLCTARWTLWTALGAGVVVGLAAGIKFTGAALVVPLFVCIATSPVALWQRVGMGAVFVAGAGSVYFGQFALGLWLTHRPASMMDVVHATSRLVERHASATNMKNPLTSSWPTWALPSRPLLLGYEVSGRNARALSAIGNLATWWGAVGVALVVGWTTLRRGIAKTFAEKKHGRATLLTLLTALAFLAPWVLTRRDSYIYHYLPIYAALVVLLAGWLAELWRERPNHVLAFVLLVLAVALFYAPVWSFFKLKIAYVEYRLPFASWR